MILETKKKKPYKCEKHLSNQGYVDDKGKWHCWFCYSENLYLNPGGITLKELEIKRYIIRIVDSTDEQNKLLRVELFIKDTKDLDHNYSCRDLSVAIRHFDSLINEILEGNYGKKNKSSVRVEQGTRYSFRTSPSESPTATFDLPEEEEWEEFTEQQEEDTQ